ncbi:MAG: hypothetical protein IIY06_11415 [Proteobacteria bacterium]|jgi:hypothetical protein|nr:hypothetical protein [Pseudomonadota bacterium]
MSLQYSSGNKVSPIFDENSRILILGSFPDVKARDVIGFCYSNPRNRFWDVMTAIFGECFPKPDINHPENKDILVAKLPPYRPMGCNQRMQNQWCFGQYYP